MNNIEQELMDTIIENNRLCYIITELEKWLWNNKYFDAFKKLNELKIESLKEHNDDR